MNVSNLGNISILYTLQNCKPKNYTGVFFPPNLIKLHKFAFCFFPCVFSAIFSLFIVNMNLPLKQEMYE